jgi:hypothetical protein
MSNKTFYAVRSESLGEKIFPFSSIRERNNFLKSNPRAREIAARSVPVRFKAPGVYVRWGNPKTGF